MSSIHVLVEIGPDLPEPARPPLLAMRLYVAEPAFGRAELPGMRVGGPHHAVGECLAVFRRPGVARALVARILRIGRHHLADGGRDASVLARSGAAGRRRLGGWHGPGVAAADD